MDKSIHFYDCVESLDLTKSEIFIISTNGGSNYKDIINCPDGYSETSISKCIKKIERFVKISLILENNLIYIFCLFFF